MTLRQCNHLTWTKCQRYPNLDYIYIYIYIIVLWYHKSINTSRNKETYPQDILNKGDNIIQVAWVLARGPGDRGSISGQVIRKTQKLVLDATLLNTLYYKVRIKGKGGQPGEMSSAPLHLCFVTNVKGDFGSASTTVASFTYFLYTCNAAANAVLQALKECESIALKLDASVDNGVNLNLR